jgi:hypothetical protein
MMCKCTYITTGFWGQFFKTSIGANSAECHRCIGASSPRRHENPFKKLASEYGPCFVPGYDTSSNPKTKLRTHLHTYLCRRKWKPDTDLNNNLLLAAVSSWPNDYFGRFFFLFFSWWLLVSFDSSMRSRGLEPKVKTMKARLFQRLQKYIINIY